MANSNRGFAAMDPAKQKEIASKGGKASRSGRGSSSISSKRGANLTTDARREGGRSSHKSN